MKNSEETTQAQVQDTLEKSMRSLLNSYSVENSSNTPDFILSNYLINCLDNFNTAVRKREKWYGISLSPGYPENQVIIKESKKS